MVVLEEEVFIFPFGIGVVEIEPGVDILICRIVFKKVQQIMVITIEVELSGIIL